MFRETLEVTQSKNSHADKGEEEKLNAGEYFTVRVDEINSDTVGSILENMQNKLFCNLNCSQIFN